MSNPKTPKPGSQQSTTKMKPKKTSEFQLEQENVKLKEELAEVKASQIIYEEACVKALNQRDLLQSQLATAREALKFYSDPKNP